MSFSQTNARALKGVRHKFMMALTYQHRVSKPQHSATMLASLLHRKIIPFTITHLWENGDHPQAMKESIKTQNMLSTGL